MGKYGPENELEALLKASPPEDSDVDTDAEAEAAAEEMIEELIEELAEEADEEDAETPNDGGEFSSVRSSDEDAID